MMDDYENIYGLLERKLWDDPNPVCLGGVCVGGGGGGVVVVGG